MSDAYRQLRQLLPTDYESPRTRFPLEAKRIASWVDSLPRVNQQAVLRDLDDALASINAQRCDAAQRFAALEALRPVVLESVQLQFEALTGASFPLTPSQARSAEQIHRLHRQLVLGYIRVVVDTCAPGGSVPFLRGAQVAASLQRAMSHASRRLALNYWLYLSPAAGVWLELHALYGFALAAKQDGKSVTDTQFAATGSPALVYQHAVLTALSNPYRFNQREQLSLWALCADMARHCAVFDRDSEQGRFALAIADDTAPNQISADDDAECRWFDLAALAEAVDRSLGDVRDADVMLRLGRGNTVVASADLLRRLRGGWVPAAARGHQRLQAGHRLDTVVGLSDLHCQLAEGQSFDDFMQRFGGTRDAAGVERAAWVRDAEGNADVRVTEAQVLDQSLGGYRLRWDAEQQVRAKVGELIGLSMGAGNDLQQWMVGTIRWLRYDPDGGVFAGVELLARRAQPIGVRIIGNDGISQPARRGVRLQPLQPVADGDWIVLTAAVVDPRLRLEVVHNSAADDVEQYGFTPAASNLLPGAVLEHAGSYILFTAQTQDAMVRT